jgi:hypothetical protein
MAPPPLSHSHPASSPGKTDVRRRSVLYAFTVHASVHLLYRDGVKAPLREPLVGQIFSDWHKGVPILRLWPLNWTDSTSPLQPLAVLWHPVCVAVTFDSFCFRGIEAVQQGRIRRWGSQKWLCDFLTPQLARARLEPDQQVRTGRGVSGLD